MQELYGCIPAFSVAGQLSCQGNIVYEQGDLSTTSTGHILKVGAYVLVGQHYKRLGGRISQGIFSLGILLSLVGCRTEKGSSI